MKLTNKYRQHICYISQQCHLLVELNKISQEYRQKLTTHKTW